MADLLAALVPEMLGLLATPAAVIACLILLGSSHPARNVTVFAAMFLLVYGVIAFGALAAGRTGSGSDEDPSTVRGWSGFVLGLLFLGLGITALARHPDPSRAQAPPAWAVRLTDPSLRFVAGLGLLLAVLNPNVAILGSGAGVVLTADVSVGEQVVGVVLLLAASMLDFLIPSVAFALGGQRGRAWLRGGTHWLILHNRVIGAWVLVVFGLLFTLRGLAHLVG